MAQRIGSRPTQAHGAVNPLPLQLAAQSIESADGLGVVAGQSAEVGEKCGGQSRRLYINTRIDRGSRGRQCRGRQGSIHDDTSHYCKILAAGGMPQAYFESGRPCGGNGTGPCVAQTKVHAGKRFSEQREIVPVFGVGHSGGDDVGQFRGDRLAGRGRGKAAEHLVEFCRQPRFLSRGREVGAQTPGPLQQGRHGRGIHRGTHHSHRSVRTCRRGKPVFAVNGKGRICSRLLRQGPFDLRNNVGRCRRAAFDKCRPGHHRTVGHVAVRAIGDDRSRR